MKDQIPEFSFCPRCGDQCFEYLRDQSHCVACLYSPAFDIEYVQIPDEALRALAERSEEPNPEERLIEAELNTAGVA